MNTLYLYDNEIQLLYVDRFMKQFNTDNKPMNNTPIKIHKGIENEIKFRVHNPDRKLENINGFSIRAALISTESSERVLEKMCLLSAEKGLFSLHITDSESERIAAGFYNLVITAQESFVTSVVGEVLSSPFYSDTSGNIISAVEVLDVASTTPIPTVELLGSSFTESNETPGRRTFISSAIPASRVRNSMSGLHTLAIYAKNFTGTVFLKGSLDNTPSVLIADYFDIDITSLQSEVEYVDFTGIDPIAFSANFMWLKVVFQYDDMINQGTIDKILVRT